MKIYKKYKEEEQPKEPEVLANISSPYGHGYDVDISTELTPEEMIEVATGMINFAYPKLFKIKG